MPVAPDMMIANTPSFSQLVTSTDTNNVKLALNKIAWEWFDAHAGDTIFTVKKWFFNFNITVDMLTPVFSLIFGPAQ